MFALSSFSYFSLVLHWVNWWKIWKLENSKILGGKKVLNNLMLIILYKFWKGKKYDFTVEGKLGSESEQGTWPINYNWMCDHG